MYEIPYIINDNAKDISICSKPVKVQANIEDINQVVEQGWLQLDGLFSPEQIEEFRQAIDRIVATENSHPSTEHNQGNGHYLRSLLDKDSAFHSLLYSEKPLSISRALIGPQVAFDVEARVVPEGIPELRVSWHIHFRIVPDPIPPFFTYPQGIHCLLYLDDVDMASGPICLLPGSHLDPLLAIPKNNDADREGQMVLPVKAGTCLLLHSNLWHRTIPTTKDARQRRVILFGYNPSWMRQDVARGVKVDTTLTDELRREAGPELRELLGEFIW